MKEKYVKPLILCENYTFSQNIAASCGDTHTSEFGQSNHYDANSCQWELDSETLLFDSRINEGCNAPNLLPSWDDNMVAAIIDAYLAAYGMCYNNPDGSQALFSSI